MMRTHEPDASRLEVVTFNGWTRNRDWRGNLTDVAEATGWPHVIVGQEGYRFGGSIPGYQRSDARELGGTEARATFLLVRDDVEILSAGGKRVPGSWRGPKHGLYHDGRVFPRVTVRLPDGGVWDVIGVHRVPGGPNARIEENRAMWAAEDDLLRAWVQRRRKARPNRPIVLAGDHNDRTGTRHGRSITGLAVGLGGVLAVKGIDGFVVVGAKARKTRKLRRRFGSDGHRPVRSTLVKESP